MQTKLFSRKSIAVLAAGGALAVAGVAAGGSSADPVATAAGAKKVNAGDNFFSPRKAKIAIGGKVKWTNIGKADHNVSFNGSTSPNFSAGEGYVQKFTRAGKYPYVCTLHEGMAGKVVVGG